MVQLAPGRDIALTIRLPRCGIFPLPHFTIERGLAAPGRVGAIFDTLWVVRRGAAI